MTVNQTNGQVFTGDDVKALGKIYEVYTGSGFNASGGGGATNNVELTAITAANIGNADYVVIQGSVFGKAEKGSATLLIESKEIGGSYATDVTITVATNNTNLTNPNGTGGIAGVYWVHTLTAGEKTNGIQFRLTGTSSGLNDGSISNVCIVTKSGYA